ncbi:MAG: GtrA family protein [bacterium]|nr:GtrA family protein [bacterium]
MLRFLKFCIVGGTGTIVNLIIFGILNFSGMNYMLSSIISFILSATFVYEINTLWTFKDRGHKSSKKLWVKYMCVSTCTLGINLLTLYLSENYLMPVLNNYWIFQKIFEITGFLLKTNNIEKITALYSQCLGIGVGTIFNFFGSNFITYKKK